MTSQPCWTTMRKEEMVGRFYEAVCRNSGSCVLPLTLAHVRVVVGAADGAAGTRLECGGCFAGSTNVLRPRCEHHSCLLFLLFLIYSDADSGSICFVFCCQITPASAHMRQKKGSPVNQRANTSRAGTTESWSATNITKEVKKTI